MKRIVILLICFLCLTVLASGQVEQGDTEVQFLGYLASGSDMTMGTVQALLGYYLTPKLQFGIGPGVTITSYSYPDFNGNPVTETEVDFSSMFFGTYNFSTSKQLVPYISATWYQNSFDIPEGQSFTDFAFITAGGGVKYFLSEYVAINSSMLYGFSFGNGDGLILLYGGLSVFL
jgi:hypothetical protein